MGLLRPDYFKNLNDRTFFAALSQYYGEHKSMPIFFSSFEAYALDGDASRTQEDKDAVKELLRIGGIVYKDIAYDQAPIQKSIVDFAKKEATRDLMKKMSVELASGGSVDSAQLVEDSKQIDRLGQISGVLDGASVDHFLVAGIPTATNKIPKVIVNPIAGMNDWRPMGGQSVGEHYILLSGTKSYKTTIAMNLAVGYVRNGYKVVYIDNENGADILMRRARQCLANLTVDEIYAIEGGEMLKAVHSKLSRIAKTPDLYIKYLPPDSSMHDVESFIDILGIAYGFVPDVIIYDDLDHFDVSGDKKQSREPWKEAGQRIARATALNIKYNSISWQVAQIQRGANKDTGAFDYTDIGDSFSKVKIAHGVIAAFIGEWESANSCVRLEMLTQREGKRREKLNPVIIEIDAERNTVKQSDLLPPLVDKTPKKKPR